MIAIGQVHVLIRHGLNLRGQFRNLSPILLIGWCDVQGQKMPQGVDGGVTFGAFTALLPIGPGARTTFRSGLHSSAVENRSAGIGSTARGQTL